MRNLSKKFFSAVAKDGGQVAQVREMAYGGIAVRIEYPNGYGFDAASSFMTSGGECELFELAVMKGDRQCYTTPITDNVIGSCNEEELIRLAVRIAALPA